MAKITAAEVNKLRKQTGAGMMYCKKALVESEGDFDKAIQILTKKAQKVAEERGERDANEGVVIAGKKGTLAAMIVLNCETDSIAKNEDFHAVAKTILDVAFDQKPASVDELKALKFDYELTLSEKITYEVGKIGDRLDFAELSFVSSDNVIAY